MFNIVWKKNSQLYIKIITKINLIINIYIYTHTYIHVVSYSTFSKIVVSPYPYSYGASFNVVMEFFDTTHYGGENLFFFLVNSNTYSNTHKNSNTSVLNRIYNTLYNQSTIINDLTFVIIDWNYK